MENPLNPEVESERQNLVYVRMEQPITLPKDYPLTLENLRILSKTLSLPMDNWGGGLDSSGNWQDGWYNAVHYAALDGSPEPESGKKFEQITGLLGDWIGLGLQVWQQGQIHEIEEDLDHLKDIGNGSIRMKTSARSIPIEEFQKQISQREADSATIVQSGIIDPHKPSLINEVQNFIGRKVLSQYDATYSLEVVNGQLSFILEGELYMGQQWLANVLTGYRSTAKNQIIGGARGLAERYFSRFLERYAEKVQSGEIFDLYSKLQTKFES